MLIEIKSKRIKMTVISEKHIIKPVCKKECPSPAQRAYNPGTKILTEKQNEQQNIKNETAVTDIRESRYQIPCEYLAAEEFRKVELWNYEEVKNLGNYSVVNDVNKVTVYNKLANKKYFVINNNIHKSYNPDRSTGDLINLML